MNYVISIYRKFKKKKDVLLVIQLSLSLNKKKCTILKKKENKPMSQSPIFCNPFGAVPHDKYYSNLQAPCRVGNFPEPIPGELDLLLINDVGTTALVNGEIVTTGTGGNRTFGNNSNNFSVYHLRSLTQLVVGSDPTTSEFQSVQAAVNAAPAGAVFGSLPIIYLQPQQTYVGNLTIDRSLVLNGQDGGSIVGNITILPGVIVFMQDLVIQGAVTTNAASLIMTNSLILTGDATSLSVGASAGVVNAHNSNFINSSLANPTILFTGGTSIDIGFSIIVNNTVGGFGIRMLDSFTGAYFIRGNRLPNGNHRFTGRNSFSSIDGNVFDSTTTDNIALELIGIGGTGQINFYNNTVSGTMTLLKDTSTSENFIVLNSNQIYSSSIGIITSNNSAIGASFLPFVSLTGNVFYGTVITTTYTANTVFDVTYIANNTVFNGSVSVTLTSGTPGQLSLIGNQLANSFFSSNEVIVYLKDNLIEFAIASPVTITYTNAVSNNNFYLLNNWISTQGNVGIIPLTATLSNNTHALLIMQNSFLSETLTALFSVALAGGATFTSDGNNNNINGSPVGTAPAAMPANV